MVIRTYRITESDTRLNVADAVAQIAVKGDLVILYGLECEVVWAGKERDPNTPFAAFGSYAKFDRKGRGRRKKEPVSLREEVAKSAASERRKRPAKKSGTPKSGTRRRSRDA